MFWGNEMLQRLVVVWIVLLLTLPHVVHAQAKEGPSFDCKKASSINEKIICSDAELSRKDLELAGIYKAAKSVAPNAEEFKKTATAEWKLREQSCNDRACLIQWYEKRKLQLSAITNSSSAPVAPVAASSTTSPANVVKSPTPIAAASPVPIQPVTKTQADIAPKQAAVSSAQTSIPTKTVENLAIAIVKDASKSPSTFRLLGSKVKWSGSSRNGIPAFVVSVIFDGQNSFGATLRGCVLAAFRVEGDEARYHREFGLQDCKQGMGEQELVEFIVTMNDFKP